MKLDIINSSAQSTRLCKKVPAKFGKLNFVRADGLSIGYPGLVGRRKEGNLNIGAMYK